MSAQFHNLHMKTKSWAIITPPAPAVKASLEIHSASTRLLELRVAFSPLSSPRRMQQGFCLNIWYFQNLDLFHKIASPVLEITTFILTFLFVLPLLRCQEPAEWPSKMQEFYMPISGPSPVSSYPLLCSFSLDHSLPRVQEKHNYKNKIIADPISWSHILIFSLTWNSIFQENSLPDLTRAHLSLISGL